MLKKPKILFEDNHLLVIDKPSGLTVNKSDTTKDEETLQDFTQDLIEREGDSDFVSRGGIVHRLDKETSGVIIIAKNSDSFHFLQKQFKERLIKKEYLALAHGKVEPKEGNIKVPVGRLPWNRKRFGVMAGGREAETDYVVLQECKMEKEVFSFVRVFPKTGRTHQIRVHFKYINHPLFGDILYAGRKTSRKDRQVLDRVFLHASKIEFTHPTLSKIMVFESELPEDLLKIIKQFC